MEINKIYNENCLETMAKMPDNFIDLTVTSPPYDGLRTYNGYSFPFEEIAKELGVYEQVKQDGGWGNVPSKTCGNIVAKAIEIANRTAQ